MLNLDVNKWIKHDARFHGGKSNRKSEIAKKDHLQIVAGRVMDNKNNTMSLRFLIGTTIADLLDFKKGVYVGIFNHKINHNLILITKDPDKKLSYKLNQHESGAKFLMLEIRPKKFNKHDFKFEETIALNYDITENKMLLIDLSKIKWRV